MKYELVLSHTFRQNILKMQRRGYDIGTLQRVVDRLLAGEPLPAKYHDHQLNGKLKDFRECHIAPDWLLIYIRNDRELILTLTRTGTHSDLFKK